MTTPPCRGLLLLCCLAPLGTGGDLGAQSVERVTHTGARNVQPSFSRDGSSILFVSDREAGWEVWRSEADGGGARRLTDEEGPVGRPVFSAEGEAVLYYAERDGRYRLLRLASPDAAAQVVETDLRDAFRPARSPSGAVLFDGVRDDGAGGHDLYLLDSAGPRPVAPHAGYDSDGRWSPDGEWIAFHSDRGEAELHLQVWLVRADGSGLRRLTEGPAHAYPSWAPGGRCLAHTVEREGNRDLRVSALEDGWGMDLTTQPGFDGDPVWDPMGGRLLFATDRFGGTELAFLHLDDEVRERCEEPRPR